MNNEIDGLNTTNWDMDDERCGRRPQMNQLFDPLTIRDRTFRNRAWVSPMCQYAAEDGLVTPWHLVHLGKFAVGGAGLVMAESTAVVPIGRSTPRDAGLWSDEQVEAWSGTVDFIQANGAVAGLQLGHAGRKASASPPWDGSRYIEAPVGWESVGPSEIGFGTLPPPRALSTEETASVPSQFANAAVLADRAGFDVVEIHAAHGYLIHQYLSPLANQRTDDYGGGFNNRARLLLEVAEAVRGVWPQSKPLFVRLSATDWVDSGWDIEQTVEVSRLLKETGVDLIDCSSGGAVHDARIPTGPGYQVEFAERVRNEAGIAVAAVGMITEADQANQIVAVGRADAVFMAREFLRQPHWPLLAASELGVPIEWPIQFERAKPHSGT